MPEVFSMALKSAGREVFYRCGYFGRREVVENQGFCCSAQMVLARKPSPDFKVKKFL